MFNLIIGLNHAGSQIISQGSETRNLWNYDTKRKISISFHKSYIGAQSDLTEVTILSKKVKAQPLSLIGHMENFGCEL